MNKLFLRGLLALMIIIVGLSAGSAQASSGAEGDRGIIGQVEDWYEQNMGYGSITALMAVESSFIPFPSEIVVPPAAYIASKPGSNLNIWGVIIFATLGALIGAYVNYFLAMWLGRPIIHKLADSKFGKLLLLSSEKVNKAEEYFNKRGRISTVIGRLIPAVRQLISIPAGLSKMPLATFTIYTAIGAAAWNGILALLGYLAHGQADMINRYNKELSIVILAILLVGVAFLVIKKIIKRKSEKLVTK